MAKATKQAESVLIEVPVSQPDLATYASEHINVQLGCERRANAVKMLFDQLMRSGKTVRGRNGESMPVTNSGRAVLWLIDQVVDQAQESGVVLAK